MNFFLRDGRYLKSITSFLALSLGSFAVPRTNCILFIFGAETLAPGPPEIARKKYAPHMFSFGDKLFLWPLILRRMLREFITAATAGAAAS